MSHRLRDPKTLVSRWALQGTALDDMGRYPGTLVNDPTWGSFLKNNLQAIELDGNDQYVNCGDVAELNAVSQFSVAFWMSQDALDTLDRIFVKTLNTTNEINIFTFGDGNLYIDIDNGSNGNGAYFDYSTVISAGAWSHLAFVFDGSGSGNIDRIKVYVDGVQQVLSYRGTVPAATANLTGIAATIGAAVDSLNGKFHDFRLYSCALTNDEILRLFHSPVPTY